MKKVVLSLIALLVASASFGQAFFEQVPFRGAVGFDDWTSPWANWDPQNTVYPNDPSGPAANLVNVSGDITANTTWSTGNVYVATGVMHVRPGVTLTIQPGVVVRGSTSSVASERFTLIISKGARIIAEGTATQPIVFTSGFAPGARNPGDWAGILIVGNAPTNLRNQPNLPDGRGQYEALPSDTAASYGGNNPTENSGVLKFVRIEYAGYNYLPNQELNGLTLAGVGNGTVIDGVQVSYANDDAFEWFGGTVNCKRLIALGAIDDDFDADEGFNGKVQFAIGIKHPSYSDLPGASNGFEHDSNTGRTATAGSGKVANVNNPAPPTTPIFSNVTLLGPIRDGETVANLPSNHKFSTGVLIRSNAGTSLFNSIVGGFPTAVNLANGAASISPSTHTKAFTDTLTFQGNSATSTGNVFTQGNVPATWAGQAFTFTTAAFWNAAGSNNTTETSIAGFGLVRPAYTGPANGQVSQISFANVNYALSASSAYATGASFSHPKLANNILVGISRGNLANTDVFTMGNRVVINTTTPESLVLEAQVVDATGRVIKTVKNTNSELDFRFDVQAAPGIYFVKALGRNGFISTRVYLGQ